MRPYRSLFLLPAFRATPNLITLSPMASFMNGAHWPSWWRVMFAILVLIVGLRHEVGADWGNYLGILDLATYVSLKEALAIGDPGYMLLNWVAAEFGLGVYFVNSVCAGLFAWGLVKFCRTQPRHWLALTVAGRCHGV
jgi:hypothetical protein